MRGSIRTQPKHLKRLAITKRPRHRSADLHNTYQPSILGSSEAKFVIDARAVVPVELVYKLARFASFQRYCI